MARTARPDSPIASLLKVLWRGPLIAIPFAIFFSVVMGGSLAMFRGVYVVSLVFSLRERARRLGGALVRDPAALGRPGQEGRPRRRDRHRRRGVRRGRDRGVARRGDAAALHDPAGVPRQPARDRRRSACSRCCSPRCSSASRSRGMFYKEALRRARSEEELNLARRIQRSFLLSQFPREPGLEVHAVNVSSKRGERRLLRRGARRATTRSCWRSPTSRARACPPRC